MPIVEVSNVLDHDAQGRAVVETAVREVLKRSDTGRWHVTLCRSARPGRISIDIRSPKGALMFMSVGETEGHESIVAHVRRFVPERSPSG